MNATFEPWEQPYIKAVKQERERAIELTAGTPGAVQGIEALETAYLCWIHALRARESIR